MSNFDKKEYDKNYAKNNLKRIPLNVQLDFYQKIKSHAEIRGETVSGFIKRAINETIAMDNAYVDTDIDTVDLQTIIKNNDV